MSKKSMSFSGYIFMESMFSLGLLCLIVGTYMSVNLFVLSRNKILQTQLAAHRIAFEEVRSVEKNQEILSSSQTIVRGSVTIHFSKINNSLVAVEVTDGDESFSIKKN